MLLWVVHEEWATARAEEVWGRHGSGWQKCGDFSGAGFRDMRKGESKVKPQTGWWAVAWSLLWLLESFSCDLRWLEVMRSLVKAKNPNKRTRKETSRPPTTVLLGKGTLEGGWESLSGYVFYYGPRIPVDCFIMNFNGNSFFQLLRSMLKVLVIRRGTDLVSKA